MPARPAWISRINEICQELERLPRPFIDRSRLEVLLQVLFEARLRVVDHQVRNLV